VAGSAGLTGIQRLPVSVEPRLLLDGRSAELTETNLSYNDGLLTNGAILTPPLLGRIDLTFSNSLTVSSNSWIDATGVGGRGMVASAVWDSALMGGPRLAPCMAVLWSLWTLAVDQVPRGDRKRLRFGEAG